MAWPNRVIDREMRKYEVVICLKFGWKSADMQKIEEMMPVNTYMKYMPVKVNINMQKFKK